MCTIIDPGVNCVLSLISCFYPIPLNCDNQLNQSCYTVAAMLAPSVDLLSPLRQLSTAPVSISIATGDVVKHRPRNKQILKRILKCATTETHQWCCPAPVICSVLEQALGLFIGILLEADSWQKNRGMWRLQLSNKSGVQVRYSTVLRPTDVSHESKQQPVKATWRDNGKDGFCEARGRRRQGRGYTIGDVGMHPPLAKVQFFST